MLTRQKVLLSLVQQAPNPVGRILLFKYAFLLSREHNLPSDISFYQFLPFKYGPYSFALARELEVLERYGYLRGDSGRYGVSPGMENATNAVVRQLPQELQWQISSVVSKYGTLKKPDLLRMVYAAYPSFTFRSLLREFVPPSAVEPATACIGIYTLGYECKSVDSFFDIILQAGLKSIVDVRANPVSRKYGFAKSSLSALAKKLNLGYLHIADLGIPSLDRRGLGTSMSYKKLLDDYEFRVLPERLEAQRVALGAITAQPSVLVCMEKDATFCHRGRLAKTLASESGLPIRHL